MRKCGGTEPCGSIASLHGIGMRYGNMWKAGQVGMGKLWDLFGACSEVIWYEL